MAELSTTFSDLWLLQGKVDFREYAVNIASQATRTIAILSRKLDPCVYGHNDFIQTISQLARSNRHAQIRLLLKDPQPVIDNSHPLIKLAQRLPSKIAVRKIMFEPDNNKCGYLLSDNHGILYQSDDGCYQGFANLAAHREVKQLREQFNFSWQHGEPVREFQLLNL